MPPRDETPRHVFHLIGTARMNVHVEHHPERSRFQATVDGQLCVAEYELHGRVMHMTHTLVPAPVGGRGIAAELVRSALAYVAANGLRVKPVCSYVRAYMQRHPETLALQDRETP